MKALRYEQGRLHVADMAVPRAPDEALVRMTKDEAHWIVLAVLVLCALYFLVIRLTNRPAAPAADTAD